MKTFQQQLLPILTDRFRGHEGDIKRHLDEASTPAAQTLITYIRQWEFGSRNIALGRLIECERWNDKGELVLERDFKGKSYTTKNVPLAMAWERYVYGDQRQQYIPMYSFASSMKRIPKHIEESWAEEIKGLFYDVNHMSVTAFKIISLGKCVKALGVGNPHTFAQWSREVREFKDAQKAIDDFVVTREDWKHLTTESLQNPKHREEMSKVLEDILAKADSAVEPSMKAIREQDRRLYIRQDATHARNDVKSLGKFFKKYSQPEVNALTLIGGMVDDVEAQTLSAKPDKA